MGHEIVTVGTYLDAVKAGFDKSLLESEGVLCVLDNENLYSTHFLYGMAGGGIRLQVRGCDADRAREILAEVNIEGGGDLADFEEEDFEDEQPIAEDEESFLRCEKCGSVNVILRTRSKHSAYLSIMLFGLPLPFLDDKAICRACGHSWNED